MNYALKRVLCVSWDPKLAAARERIFTDAGCRVSSAIGSDAATEAVTLADADLLVLGHSVPRPEKRRLIDAFRGHSEAPILSLLQPGQQPLRGATLGVPGEDYATLERVVRHIIA